jgi:hypothetical protein
MARPQCDTPLVVFGVLVAIFCALVTKKREKKNTKPCGLNGTMFFIEHISFAEINKNCTILRWVAAKLLIRNEADFCSCAEICSFEGLPNMSLY